VAIRGYRRLSIDPALVDGFFMWPAFLLLALAFIAGIGISFSPESTLSYLLLAMEVFAAWVLMTLMYLVGSAIKRLWKRSLAIVIIGVLMGPAAVFMMKIPGDYVHALVLYPHYMEIINKDADGHPAYTEFYWGDTGFGGVGNTTRKLVYQPGDEPPTPSDENETETHLIGHFYLVVYHYN
jgi:hypothetical protein